MWVRRRVARSLSRSTLYNFLFSCSAHFRVCNGKSEYVHVILIPWKWSGRYRHIHTTTKTSAHTYMLRRLVNPFALGLIADFYLPTANSFLIKYVDLIRKRTQTECLDRLSISSLWISSIGTRKHPVGVASPHKYWDFFVHFLFSNRLVRRLMPKYMYRIL